MSDLRGLLERVEAASGPDTALDHDIAFEFEDHGVDGWLATPLTGSTDAAIRLVEQLYPKARVELVAERNAYTNGNDLFECEIRNWGEPASVPHVAYSKRNLALAILAALLRAKIAEAA